MVGPSLEDLQWTDHSRASSLTEVFSHAREHAERAARWYAARVPKVRRRARATRSLSVLCGVASVVLPLLSQLAVSNKDLPAIAPGWAALAAALAAGLVTLDHWAGHSRAWMRFMLAQHRLQTLADAFTYDWNITVARAARTPGADAADQLLELARALVIAVDDLLLAETTDWVGSFSAALQASDQPVSADSPP